MNGKKTDLRVIRTKRAIRDALVELIGEKGFEAITVKDITARAKINRGTFYTHYLDKYDLLNKCEEEIMLGLANIAKRKFPLLAAEQRKPDAGLSPNPLIVAIFEFISEHAGFLKAILGPKGDPSFQHKLKTFMQETLIGGRPDSPIREDRMLVPARYFVTYVGSAHIGVIQQWLESGRKESPGEMARILSTFVVHGPLYAAGLKKESRN
jgi:AcrR family transcriptional regulator